jgi:hypothetical protein
MVHILGGCLLIVFLKVSVICELFLADGLIDLLEVNRVLLVKADVAVAHQDDLKLVRPKVTGQANVEVLACVSLESNALHGKQLVLLLVSDDQEPRALFWLWEVGGAHKLLVVPVGSLDVHHHHPFASFLEQLAHLDFFKRVGLDH